MKNYLFALAVLVLVGITGLCVKNTVRAQEKLDLVEKEQFYREQEKNLLQDTEDYLAQIGYLNCGITLNRVVEGNTDRTYTFTIHHKKIDRMGTTERQALAERLRALTEDFPCASREDTCEFEFLFLTLSN